MKKLIEELEKLENFLDGIEKGVASECLRIVRKYDPWIPISEGLPPMEFVNGTQARYSITVLGANSYEIIGAVFCHANEKTGIPDWYITGQRDTVKVTHWAYLPEVKP